MPKVDPLPVKCARVTRAVFATESPPCREPGREAAQHGCLSISSAFT
jgi:hypothetical protein